MLLQLQKNSEGGFMERLVFFFANRFGGLRRLRHPTYLWFLCVGCVLASVSGIVSKAVAQSSYWKQLGNFPHATAGEVRSMACAANGDVFAGTEQGYVYYSKDDGESWRQSGLSSSAQVDRLLAAPDGRVIAAILEGSLAQGYRSRLVCSMDSGSTWFQIGLFENDRVSELVVDSAGNVFVGLFKTGVFRLKKDSAAWQRINSPAMGSGCRAIAVDRDGNIFTSVDSGLFRSTDHGDTWSFLSRRSPFRIACSPEGDIFALITIAHCDIGVGSIYRSTDNGVTWVPSYADSTFPCVINPSPVEVICIAINSQGHIFGGGGAPMHGWNEAVILESTDRGIQWTWRGGFINDVVKFLAVNTRGYVFAGMAYGQVWRSINPTVGANGPTSELPASYMLLQNYPNPLSARGASAYGGNPSTTIMFDLPQRTSVKLVIYDVLGREVKTLVDEEKAPGTYEVKFSAAELPSGIYFYKLTAGQFSAVRKMIVMR